MTTGYLASFEPSMRAALAEAAAATESGDVPVGAVVLDGAGTIVARGRNRREADGDPTAHAVQLVMMAVEVGFEPTEELPPHALSRRAPSATRRLHRG